MGFGMLVSGDLEFRGLEDRIDVPVASNGVQDRVRVLNWEVPGQDCNLFGKGPNVGS